MNKWTVTGRNEIECGYGWIINGFSDLQHIAEAHNREIEKAEREIANLRELLERAMNIIGQLQQ